MSCIKIFENKRTEYEKEINQNIISPLNAKDKSKLEIINTDKE